MSDIKPALTKMLSAALAEQASDILAHPAMREITRLAALGAAVERLMYHDVGAIDWGGEVWDGIHVWAHTEGHYFEGGGDTLSAAITEALSDD